jgi:hypothetical protein
VPGIGHCGREGLRATADKGVAAKTVMLLNESGTSRFGDDLCRQIKAWNRWQVVTDRGEGRLDSRAQSVRYSARRGISASATASGQTVYGNRGDSPWKHGNAALAPIRNGR